MSKEPTREMSFLEHLEELRWHIIRSCIALIVFGIAAFLAKGFIFDTILMAPKNPEFFTNRVLASIGIYINQANSFSLISTQMAGQFSAHVMISMVAALVLAFPYLIWELSRFIMPALYPQEQKYAKGGVFVVSALFVLGVLFGYYLIVPLSIEFLGSYQVSEQVLNTINLNSYFQIVASVTLATGVLFELPVFILFLTKIGLVTPDFLAKYRKVAFIIALTVAAVITPPDVFSQILVTIPIMILYEVSIWFSRKSLKKEADSSLPARNA